MVGRRPINGTPMSRQELAQRAYNKRKQVIADLEQRIDELRRMGMEVLAATSLYDARIAVAKTMMKKERADDTAAENTPKD